ncbi:ankyrin repeat-containing domain protein [Xylaria cf. heliscus]|nr:ankyrin repeat-containing domain protein [Xylaria cf. heliscus]
MYHKTVESAIDAQRNLFGGERGAPPGSLQICQFIRNEEDSLFTTFLCEDKFPNNPLAAFITLSCNTEVAIFQNHHVYPSYRRVSGATVNRLRDSGDIGTALVLQEYRLMEQCVDFPREISTFELQKYCDIYFQTTERLKAITGYDIPAVPPLHNLLFLTKGKFISPSDMTQTRRQDYIGRSLLHLALDLDIEEYVLRNIKGNAPEIILGDFWGRQLIHIACTTNFEAIAKHCLCEFVDPDITDMYGCSALHYAAASGSEKTIQFLLENDANVNHQDPDGFSPLAWAVQRGHIVAFQLLVLNGGGIHVKDSQWYEKQLCSAAQGGHRAIVEWLLKTGTNINSTNKYHSHTPLSLAAQEGHRTVVELLLEKGADFNEDEFPHSPPLFNAVKNGHADVVRLLLEKCIHRHITACKMLFLAASENHATTVQVLLENGADPNLEFQGYTPLQMAIDKGYDAVANILRAAVSG